MDPETTILLVDDEENILRSLKRVFLDQDFRILTTTSPFDALELLRTHIISVIVSDNLMPGMSGIDFLQQAKFISPESVRVMMTGYADVRAAIDAINKGEVFKFLTKPWDVEEFRNVVFDSIGRHDMVHSLRQADESKLYSLAQTIELKDPYTRGHCDRVAQYSLAMAESLGLENDQRTFIKYGSWLHDCGKIGVPEAILNFNGPLLPEQMEIVRNHSRWGAEVARLAKLPDAVVNVILFHHEKYDGTGYPANLKGNGIPLEARIVSVADIFDALTSARPYRGAMAAGKAADILVEGKNTHSDPAIVDIFLKTIEKGD